MSDLIGVEARDGVTRLTLCRPEKGNSLSADMVAAMASAVERCYADGTTLLILDAQGRNFCTGFDLGDLNQQSDDSLMARFIRIELLLQALRSEEHTSELQSLMRISYAVFCLKKKKRRINQ